MLLVPFIPSRQLLSNHLASASRLGAVDSIRDQKAAEDGRSDADQYAVVRSAVGTPSDRERQPHGLAVQHRLILDRTNKGCTPRSAETAVGDCRQVKPFAAISSWPKPLLRLRRAEHADRLHVPPEFGDGSLRDDTDDFELRGRRELPARRHVDRGECRASSECRNSKVSSDARSYTRL